MKIKHLLAIATIVTASPTARAAEVADDSGNDLLHTCSETDFYSAGYCLGYVRGLSSGADAALSMMNKKICYTSGVTIKQLQDVVVAYIRRNPATRNKNAIILTIEASMEAWPCKEA